MPERTELVRAEEVLSSAELRARLDARQRDIQNHLAGLRHELSTVADVTVAGRPVLDHVRSEPLRALAVSAAAGATLGVLVAALGRLFRQKPDESEEGVAVRLLVGSLLDEAAERVARGEDTDVALRRAARRHSPTIYYAPQSASARGMVRETLDLAVKSALGFAVKTGMDVLAEKLTGTPEVFAAVEEVEQNPPPRRA